MANLLIMIPLSIFLVYILIWAIMNYRTQEEIVERNFGNEEANSIFIKKYSQVSLARFRKSYLLIGMIVSMGFVITAFTWTEKPDQLMDLGTEVLEDDLELEAPPTKQEKPPPPPPPPPKLEVVKDEEILEDEPEIEDVEIEEDVAIEVIEVPEEEEPEEPEIFTIVEQMPVFPGGEVELMRYIRKNIKYPPIARENNIEGLVVVTFVVEPTGSISNIKVLRDIGGGCGSEAVRIIRSMPSWKPGKQRGKPVKVQYNLPIRFKLE